MSATFFLKTTELHAPDPTREQVAELLAGLPALPYNNFLIVERTDAASRTVSISYLQTHPHSKPAYEGDFVIEYRDGVTGRHYKSYAAANVVTEIFSSYLRDDDLWRQAALWRDISHQFEDLCVLLPPEELVSSYFPDGEWQKALDAKRQRDEAFWDVFETEETS